MFKRPLIFNKQKKLLLYEMPPIFDEYFFLLPVTLNFLFLSDFSMFFYKFSLNLNIRSAGFETHPLHNHALIAWNPTDDSPCRNSWNRTHRRVQKNGASQTSGVFGL